MLAGYLSQLCWTYKQIILTNTLSEWSLFIYRGLAISTCFHASTWPASTLGNPWGWILILYKQRGAVSIASHPWHCSLRFALLGHRSLPLGEASPWTVRTVTQPYGDIHITRNWGHLRRSPTSWQMSQTWGQMLQLRPSLSAQANIFPTTSEIGQPSQLLPKFWSTEIGWISTYYILSHLSCSNR